MMRGIRGAIVARGIGKNDVLEATEELLCQLVSDNDLAIEDIGAVLFSVTPDIQVAFPAAAARRLGWQYVPLFDCLEIGVEDGLAACIRVLVLAEMTVTQRDVRHVYLGGAQCLRPDLISGKIAEGEF